MATLVMGFDFMEAIIVKGLDFGLVKLVGI
jgi:hypothetical protein